MKQRIESGIWKTGSKNHSIRSAKRKENFKNEGSVRGLWDDIKYNNIHIGAPEGEEGREKGIENLFEEIMIENFPNH